MGKFLIFSRIKLKFRFWLYKKRWHTLWKLSPLVRSVYRSTQPTRKIQTVIFHTMVIFRLYFRSMYCCQVELMIVIIDVLWDSQQLRSYMCCVQIVLHVVILFNYVIYVHLIDFFKIIYLGKSVCTPYIHTDMKFFIYLF